MNACFGWTWVLAGLLSGASMGLRFRDDGWLGGYASLRRRLVRLGHVSLVALGALNVLFELAAPGLALPAPWLAVASWAFVAGAVTMPACCALVAWRPALHWLFPVPVSLLVLAVSIVVAGEVRS